MRTSNEILDTILGIAKDYNQIRAVYMNGSRTNPIAPKDIFQDYDIVYVVTEVESFISDNKWLDRLGKLLMLQEPEKNDKALGKDIDLSQNYGYLMLFTDGNRIDLHIQTKDYMLTTYKTDSLTIPLLDKDGCLPVIPSASDEDFWTRRPTEIQYFSVCNDFWWCMQNVAKGVWREELPYARQMYELVIRPGLDQMVSWWIGMQHDFQVSPGKMGKHFKNLLPNKYWNMYRRTYSDSDYENTWDAVFISCDLFRGLALDVADKLSFDYLHVDDQNMTKYLKRVRELPKDAKGIF